MSLVSKPHKCRSFRTTKRYRLTDTQTELAQIYSKIIWIIFITYWGFLLNIFNLGFKWFLLILTFMRHCISLIYQLIIWSKIHLLYLGTSNTDLIKHDRSKSNIQSRLIFLSSIKSHFDQKWNINSMHVPSIFHECCPWLCFCMVGCAVN